MIQPIPEYIGGEKLIQYETSVLIGYYNSEEQYEWIHAKKLYNFKMGTGNGSFILDKSTLLLNFYFCMLKGINHPVIYEKLQVKVQKFMPKKICLLLVMWILNRIII